MTWRATCPTTLRKTTASTWKMIDCRFIISQHRRVAPPQETLRKLATITIKEHQDSFINIAILTTTTANRATLQGARYTQVLARKVRRLANSLKNRSLYHHRYRSFPIKTLVANQSQLEQLEREWELSWGPKRRTKILLGTRATKSWKREGGLEECSWYIVVDRYVREIAIAAAVAVSSLSKIHGQPGEIMSNNIISQPPPIASRRGSATSIGQPYRLLRRWILSHQISTRISSAVTIAVWKSHNYV